MTRSTSEGAGNGSRSETDPQVSTSASDMEPALKFVLDALTRATCFVFGDDSRQSHWTRRFYLVRIEPSAPGSGADRRRGVFLHSSVWVIRHFPEERGAWSRSGWWLACPKTTDPADPDAVRWTFADGWAECERILREGVHLPEWQQAKLAATEAAGRRGTLAKRAKRRAGGPR